MFQSIIKTGAVRACSGCKIILLLVLTVMLVSCLDISAAVTITEDSGIQVQLRYQLSAFMIQLAKTSDFASYLPVPASYDELVQKVGGFTGVTISENSSAVSNAVQCQLDFPNIETMAAFFESQALELIPGTEGVNALRLIINGPALVAGTMMSENNELKSYIETVFASSNAALSFTGGGLIISGTGFSTVDNVLVYSSPINNLIFMENPVLLDLSW
ncbi:MAG: hypothetical protein KKI09_00050 [Spirochaetes bacterium]|nr:hypothetical protein [Spirochaetota bacterium]